MSTAQDPPGYPYLEVFSGPEGYDIWRVTGEDSSHQRSFDTLDELVAALKAQKLPVVTDSPKFAEELKQAGVAARFLPY